MKSSTAARLPLPHTSSKYRRTRALFFSSAATGASSSPLANSTFSTGSTPYMMPPGGLRNIGWRLIHPSAWKKNSPKFMRLREMHLVSAQDLLSMTDGVGIRLERHRHVAAFDGE